MNSNWRPNLSLSSRMTLVVLPFVIGGFVLGSYFTVKQVRQHLENDVKIDMEDSAHRVMSIADAEFAALYAHLKLHSENNFLTEILQEKKFDRLFDLLRHWKKALKVYSAIEVYRPDGQILAASSRARFESLIGTELMNMSGADWFRKSIEGITGHSEVESSEHFQSLIINFHAPLYSADGRLTGVLRMVYHPKYIFEALRQKMVEAQERGRKSWLILILDKEGRFVFHPDASRVLTKTPNPELQRQFAVGEGFQTYTSDNGTAWVGAIQKETGYRSSVPFYWTAAVAQKADEALATANLIEKIFYAVGLLTSLLVSLAIALANRFLMKPLNQLRLSIAEIIKTKNFSRAIPMETKSEIGEVIEVFNRLLLDLNKTVVSKNYVDSVFMGLTDVVLVIDNENRVLSANQAAERLLGLSPEDLTGRELPSLFENDRLFSVGQIKGLIALGELNEYECYMLDKKKQPVPVFVSGNYLHGADGSLQGIILIARDARASRLMKKLDEQKSLFESVIRNMGDGLIVTDSAKNHLVFNEPGKQIIGLQNFDEKLAWAEAAAIFMGEEEAPLQRSLRGEVVNNQEVETSNRLSDESLHLSCSGRPIFNEHGEVAAGIVVFRDITEMKIAEKELGLARLKLIQSDKMATLGMMAGGIAHEINNPLTVIINSAEWLMELSEEGAIEKRYLSTTLEKIRDTGLRISDIVKGLRSVSRDSSKDQFVFKPVREILDDALVLCRQRISQAGIDLQSALALPPNENEPTIECRPSQISQVLLNLIGNAMDAVSELPEKWIRLEASLDKEHLVLRVIDSGRGIPEPIKSHVMMPFFTTKEVGKGTGLGLSISRTIIESHGGKLSIEDGANTCFKISLPLSPQNEAVA